MLDAELTVVWVQGLQSKVRQLGDVDSNPPRLVARQQSTVMSPSVSTVAMLWLQPMCLFQMAKKSPVAAERVWAAFQLPRPEA